MVFKDVPLLCCCWRSYCCVVNPSAALSRFNAITPYVRQQHPDMLCQRVYHIQRAYIKHVNSWEDRMAGRSKSGEIKRLARERIAVLFQRAGEFFPENPGWSDRCVVLARKIAMRQRVGLEWQHRRQICPHCYRFHVPGVTMRVRIRKGNVVVTCRACNKTTRYRVERSHDRED